MYNENNFDVLDYQTGSYYRDNRRSSTFGQRIGIAALYFSYGFSLGNYKLRTGIRYENTFLALTANESRITTPRYGNFLPNFLVSRTFINSLTLPHGYAKRNQRPYTVYLNPVVNYIDSLNIEYGNPTLSPVINHNYTLTYSYQKRKALLDGSVFVSRSADNIEYVRTIKPSGVTESSWFNISNYTVYGATFNFSGRENILHSGSIIHCGPYFLIRMEHFLKRKGLSFHTVVISLTNSKWIYTRQLYKCKFTQYQFTGIQQRYLLV
ncbi:MAG: TonB-dependent receptor [Chitinophagaceae bacterium]